MTADPALVIPWGTFLSSLASSNDGAQRMIGHPLKVRELLDEIARGEVLLPEIQRAYVWKGPQVAKLIDSLYHEYPSGQVLLWDTINLPITKSLEGVEKPSLPSAGRPKIVLDGQQRLTSLYKALGSGQEDEGRIDVYFNVETEQFQLYLRRLDSDPKWISVREVVTGQKGELEILQRIASAGGPGLSDPKSQEYLNRLQRLRKIGEYKFPIELFKSDDYEEVTELFVRINSAGTRLRAAELVLAQLALRLPGAIVEMFDEAMDEYGDVGYDLDARFLTRALIAVGTGQSRFRYLTEFWKKPATEVHRANSTGRRNTSTLRGYDGHNTQRLYWEGAAASDAFAWTAAGMASRAATDFLGGHQVRRCERGSGCCGWVVSGCGKPLVSAEWRDETIVLRPLIGALCVIFGARRDRHPSCEAPRGACDREAARPISVDDLARAASQRGNPRRRHGVSRYHRSVACGPSCRTTEGRQARSEPYAARLRAGPPRRDDSDTGWHRRSGTRRALEGPTPRSPTRSSLGDLVES